MCHLQYRSVVTQLIRQQDIQQGISQIQSEKLINGLRVLGWPLSSSRILSHAGLGLFVTLCFLEVQSLLSIIFHVDISRADSSMGQRPVVRLDSYKESREMTLGSPKEWRLCAGHCCDTAHDSSPLTRVSEGSVPVFVGSRPVKIKGSEVLMESR